MPTIPLHPPAGDRASGGYDSTLPQLLRTPSGLAILEVQGIVNAPPNTQDQGLNAASTSVGKLVFPHYDAAKGVEDTTWHKRVYLYVGKHQRLTGELKKLSNPIAVIRRRANAALCSERDELEIAEIVYFKLLFAHRPEPVGGGGDD